jgi:membrane dipeptidase
MLLRFLRNNSIYSDFEFDKELAGDTDLPRLRKGQVGGQFWSVFVPCPKNESDFLQTDGVRDTLEQIDVTKRLIDLYPDDVQRPPPSLLGANSS